MELELELGLELLRVMDDREVVWRAEEPKLLFCADVEDFEALCALELLEEISFIDRVLEKSWLEL